MSPVSWATRPVWPSRVPATNPNTPPPVSTKLRAAVPVNDPPWASAEADDALTDDVRAGLGLVDAVPEHAAVTKTAESAMAERTRADVFIDSLANQKQSSRARHASR